MPGINLAPGTQFILQARKRRRRLFFASGAIVIAAVLVWVGMYFYLNRLRQQQEAVAAQLRNVEMEIANLEAEARRIVLFERRLLSLDQLLNHHVSWNTLLQDVERLMPVETVLTHLDLTKNGGQAALRGVTTDIDRVALTLASLTKTETHDTVFTSARVDNIQREETQGAEPGTPADVRYSFTADLTFDPNVLESKNP